MPTTTNAITAAVTIAWLSLYLAGTVRTENQPESGGRPVGGLRLDLRVPELESGRKIPTHFNVVIQNVDEKDLNVLLGFSLNNMRAHYPQSLTMIVRRPGEKVRELVYTNHQGGIGGRVDPFLVPLPAGASYKLRCAFKDFVDPHSLEPVDLTSKDVHITLELIGRAINGNDVNLDTKYLAVTPCWEGKVRSNEVRLHSPGK